MSKRRLGGPGGLLAGAIALAVLGLLVLPVGAGQGDRPSPASTVPSSATSLTWTKLTVKDSPPGIYEGVMAYDPGDHYVLLFGGATPNGVIQNESWAFLGHRWENLSLSVAPSPRREPAMAYDPTAHSILLFGGAGPNDLGLNDTWAFANGTWTELHPAASPSGRAGASMVYDAALGGMVLFGGTSDYRCGCGVSGDVWTYANGNWTRMRGSTVPTVTIYSFGMAYDSGTRTAVAFGGWGIGGNSDETFVLAHGVWTTLAANGNSTPSRRQGSAMAYDPLLGTIVLYGGASATELNDTWVTSNGTWTPVPSSGPGPNGWGQMVYDPALRGLVLFGGYTGHHHLSDKTWLLQ